MAFFPGVLAVLAGASTLISQYKADSQKSAGLRQLWNRNAEQLYEINRERDRLIAKGQRYAIGGTYFNNVNQYAQEKADWADVQLRSDKKVLDAQFGGAGAFFLRFLTGGVAGFVTAEGISAVRAGIERAKLNASAELIAQQGKALEAPLSSVPSKPLGVSMLGDALPSSAWLDTATRQRAETSFVSGVNALAETGKRYGVDSGPGIAGGLGSLLEGGSRSMFDSPNDLFLRSSIVYRK